MPPGRSSGGGGAAVPADPDPDGEPPASGSASDATRYWCYSVRTPVPQNCSDLHTAMHRRSVCSLVLVHHLSLTVRAPTVRDPGRRAEGAVPHFDMLHADTRVHTDRESLAGSRDTSVAGEKSDKSGKFDKSDTFGGTPQESLPSSTLTATAFSVTSVTRTIGNSSSQSVDRRSRKLLPSTVRDHSM
jgi:hypothetical protein